MARPKKLINPEEVKKLAAINCSVEEIADWFSVDRRTIQRRFATLLKEGRSNGRISLKRRMYETAMSSGKGAVTMQIWLSKNMLGYTDKVEEKTKVESTETRVIEVKWADENNTQHAVQDAASKTDQSISDPV